MPGTAINNINYNDTDNKRLVEEALNEIESPQQRAPPQQQQQREMPPPDYQQQQQYEPQQPQYNPPQHHQQRQYEQQYQQQGPPQYEQQYHQGQEHFEQPKSSGFSFSLPDSAKKTLMLVVILFLINNNSFKTVLEKIPLTINADGERTFVMTIVVCSLIATIFFICSSVF